MVLLSEISGQNVPIKEVSLQLGHFVAKPLMGPKIAGPLRLAVKYRSH